MPVSKDHVKVESNYFHTTPIEALVRSIASYAMLYILLYEYIVYYIVHRIPEQESRLSRTANINSTIEDYYLLFDIIKLTLRDNGIIQTDLCICMKIALIAIDAPFTYIKER